MINQLFARDSPVVIPFFRYHFQIFLSIILSQLSQKICKHVHLTSLHFLLRLTIPSPGEEICRVEFFLLSFWFLILFKILDFSWKLFGNILLGGHLKSRKLQIFDTPPFYASPIRFHSFFQTATFTRVYETISTPSNPMPPRIIWFELSKTVPHINRVAHILSTPWLIWKLATLIKAICNNPLVQHLMMKIQ